MCCEKELLSGVRKKYSLNLKVKSTAKVYGKLYAKEFDYREVSSRPSAASQIQKTFYM